MHYHLIKIIQAIPFRLHLAILQYYLYLIFVNNLQLTKVFVYVLYHLYEILQV